MREGSAAAAKYGTLHALSLSVPPHRTTPARDSPLTPSPRVPRPGEQEAIRKNFILVYELLDETLDYGYPQGTSTETLKNHVRNEPILVDSVKSMRLPSVSERERGGGEINAPIKPRTARRLLSGWQDRFRFLLCDESVICCGC